MTNARMTTAATMVVAMGMTTHTTVSQNVSNAPVSLFVCDTRAPLKRSAWNPVLCRVSRWNTRSNRRCMPNVSNRHMAHNVIRHPTISPRIWVTAYATTNGHADDQVIVSACICSSSREMT